MEPTLKGLRTVVLAGGIFALGASANANLIINGSFEFPELGTGWGTFASILGWSAGADQIEVGYAGIYGVTGHDQDQVLEVDAYHNAIVQQILGTTENSSYTLSFGVAQRVNTLPSTCLVEVWWNGTLLDTIAPTSTVMSYYTYSVTGGVGGSTLQFRGAGTDDSYGGLVDNVILQPESVPEPVTVALSLTSLAFGAKRVHRRKQRATFQLS